MGKIVWLASYPKSGNTWMRALLTNYRSDAPEPADINALEGGPTASSRAWFDEWAGVEASALDDERIDRLRPGVYRCLAREAPDLQFMKCHDAWRLTDRGEPMFPADVTAGVIYILRNPLDLVGSCANHWGLGLEASADRLNDPELALARSLGGLSDQLRQRLGCWTGHVRSWVDESSLPVHTVRYEDLRADPCGVFGDVVRFCGLACDSERIRRAVAHSDFGELRQQEETHGFRERPPGSSDKFFRRGAVGGWRDELPEDLVDRIVATHAPMMRRFGYLEGRTGPA